MNEQLYFIVVLQHEKNEKMKIISSSTARPHLGRVLVGCMLMQPLVGADQIPLGRPRLGAALDPVHDNECLQNMAIGLICSKEFVTRNRSPQS